MNALLASGEYKWMVRRECTEQTTPGSGLLFLSLSESWVWEYARLACCNPCVDPGFQCSCWGGGCCPRCSWSSRLFPVHRQTDRSWGYLETWQMSWWRCACSAPCRVWISERRRPMSWRLRTLQMMPSLPLLRRSRWLWQRRLRGLESRSRCGQGCCLLGRRGLEWSRCWIPRRSYRHPFWEAVGRCYKYEELWRAPIVRPVHINISELRAYLKEEGRTARSLMSVRTNNALDSQVALGSLVKGRASSRALNSELSRSLAYLVGSDLYPSFGYWPSKMNRADGPTRSADVPDPDMAKPKWLACLEAGDVESYDRWLDGLPTHAEKTPSFGHLDLPMDTRSSGSMPWCDRHKEKRQKLVAKLETPVFAAGGELCEEACSILRSFDSRQFFLAADFDGSKAGALDLYSGHCGVAKRLAAGGCPWVLTFEIKRSPKEDLTTTTVKDKILSLIKLRAVRLCGSAIVCSSFSMAVTPPVRNNQFPRGVPWMSSGMREKVALGNGMGDYQAAVHHECELSDVRFWTENPDSSHLWRQRKHKKFKSPCSDLVCRVDMCRFGTRWRKRTRIATDLKSLGGVRMFCRCADGHTQLRGMHPEKKVAWTSLAQVYPRGFCKMIADAALKDCNWKRPLSLASCAKVTEGRIGEASNPGPRRAAAARGFSLEEAPVQGASSIKLGESRWRIFLHWCGSYEFSEPVEQIFAKVPVFLAHALRRYGDEDFRGGGSLSYYRHLVIAASRRFPTLKPYISICWELAARWEAVEPVCHRPPIPEPLVERHWR